MIYIKNYFKDDTEGKHTNELNKRKAYQFLDRKM